MQQPVSLQVNLAPGDYPYARLILPHQLKALAKQVDEVILTVDTKPSKGRFAEGWNENKALLDNFLRSEIQAEYDVKIVPVDYSDGMKMKIAAAFFKGGYVPEKDFRGGPFYAYFFGLYTAKHNLVFHLDSDIFLGGVSLDWITEAKVFFQNDLQCFIVSPLPGPPSPDEKLIGQSIKDKIGYYTYEFDGMSTRIFMMNRSLLETHKANLEKPGPRNQVKAILEGNPNADLPEHLLSSLMREKGLKRIDFLGTGKGLWSLHPPYRTKTLLNSLPDLIKRVGVNDLPDTQLGYYDIIDDVCDWTEAREKLKKNRWWKKAWQR